MKKSAFSTGKSAILGIGKGYEGVGSDAAVILASTSPFGINTMCTFPLSLIALGRIRRRHLNDTLTLGPKRNPMDEELAQRTEMSEVAGRIDTDKPGGQTHRLPIMRYLFRNAG